MIQTLFKDFLGNSEAVERLKYLTSQPPSSIIFSGPKRIGKETAARQFVQSVICEKSGCGTCRTCQIFLSNIDKHPDVRWLNYVLGETPPDDMISFIKGDNFKPVFSRRKFYVVNFSSPPNKVITTSLLKTLEEPLPLTTILLIVPDISWLLPTIISRSVVIGFYYPDVDTLVKIVQLQYPNSKPETIKKALELTGNNIDLVLSNDPEKIHQWSQTILEYLFQIKPDYFWEICQFCDACQENFDLTTTVCLNWCARALAYVKKNGKPINKFAEALGEEGLVRIIEILLKCKNSITFVTKGEVTKEISGKNVPLFMEYEFLKFFMDSQKT